MTVGNEMRHPLPEQSEARDPSMIQIGTIVGFFALYPANIFLLNSGWNQKMRLYQTNRTNFRKLGRAIRKNPSCKWRMKLWQVRRS